MRVVVLTPWKPDGGPRDRLYGVIGPHVAGLGLPVVHGHSGDETFSLARTWNTLAAKADEGGRWDLAVLHEADYFVTHEQIREAIAHVRGGFGGQVYAYDRHVKLTESGTERFLQGNRDLVDGEYTIGKHRIGGPRVISRVLWDAVGGFDHRFVGWGYEDNAFRDQCYAISPHRRVEGDLVNLWHPKHDPDDPYWQHAAQNRALAEEIRNGS